MCSTKTTMATTMRPMTKNTCKQLHVIYVRVSYTTYLLVVLIVLVKKIKSKIVLFNFDLFINLFF